MAKVRVYELAKELNIDSKAMVEKLKTGGLNIKNYMSTLDDAAIKKAKDIVAGAVSEVIEEKRIKPTVIRRRKKTVTVEPGKPETIVEEAEVILPEPEEPERPEEAPLQAMETFPEEADEEVEAEVAAEEPEEWKAVVIEKEAAPEEGPAGAEKVKMMKSASATEIVEAEEVEKIIEEEEPVDTGEVIPAFEEKDVAEEEAFEKEPEPERPFVRKKAREKAKKIKKKKSDQPAKIIKMPEEGPLRALLEKGREKKKSPEIIPEPEKPVEPPMEAEDFGAAVPTDLQKEKQSKKKREKKRIEKQEAMPKGYIRHRKIEIFERADLYEGRKVRPKKKEAGTKEVRRLKHTEITVPKAIKRRIKVQETVTVGELAKAMGIKAIELIKKLLAQGLPANINQSVDFETAALLADEFGYELELDQARWEGMISEAEDKPEDLEPRPPVVTIMGHVDHGKTSLLDYIRKSNIIAGESGGITQHIGAYYVEKEGGDIVFLDTPGHEAFTAMRARGAKVTDIIVLVVAADDGVMPQTREAVNHARAAHIPIIVAINKIDKPEANIDKVRRELAELELIPEEWGGDTIFGHISAKTGEGVDELLELILLQAEMLELKANPNKEARGTIIEARLDKSRGALATVLIKNGTLRQGDHFVCGGHYGRVRAMLNHRGKRMTAAGPAMPVEIYGISGVPNAGDEFIVVKEERIAKQVVEHRLDQQRTHEAAGRGVVSLDDLFEKIKEGEVKELNIVLKTDVQGSLEAVSDSLLKLSTSEVKVKIIHSSTGAISETDVMLASASGAIVIGFNVRANLGVMDIAKREGVDIRYYDVIYNAIQDIRNAMVGLLEPVYKENVIGRVDVKEVFHVPKVGTIAGCYVTDGHVERNAHVRLLRDEVVVFDGKLASLRRFKDDVKEVQAGYECGIGLENFQDIKPGDVLEIYQIEEIAAEL